MLALQLAQTALKTKSKVGLETCRPKGWLTGSSSEVNPADRHGQIDGRDITFLVFVCDGTWQMQQDRRSFYT